MEGYLSKKSGRVKGLHSWRARFFQLQEGTKFLRYWPDSENRAKGRPCKDLPLLDFMCYKPKVGGDQAKCQYRFVAIVSCLTTDDGGGAIGLQERRLDLKALNPASFQIWLPLVAIFHPDEPSRVSSPSDKTLLKVFLPDDERGYCTIKLNPSTTGLEVKEFVLHTLQKRSSITLNPDDFLLVDGDHPVTNETLVQRMLGESAMILSMRRASNTVEHLTLWVAETSRSTSESRTLEQKERNAIQKVRTEVTLSNEGADCIQGRVVELRTAVSQAQLQQSRIANTWREMQLYLRAEQAAEETIEAELDVEIERFSNLLSTAQYQKEFEDTNLDDTGKSTPDALDLS